MKRIFFAAAIATQLAGCATSTPVQDPQESVRQAEQSRFMAMTANDLERLAPLLADDLIYIHADGKVDSKTEFLRSLRDGTQRYRSIEPTEARIRTYGNTAVVNGLARVKVARDSVDREFDARYTAIYRASGNGWQLVSWQSTRLQQ